MLPDRCSIKEKGRDCVNPPEFIISIVSDNDEYMVGVTCDIHRKIFSTKLGALQKEDKMPQGAINFSALKPVGTDCIKAHPDDLVQID